MRKFLIINDDKQAECVSKTKYIQIMKARTKGYEKARLERLLYFSKKITSYRTHLKRAAFFNQC